MYEQYLEDSYRRLKSIIDDSGTRPILFVGTGISRRYIGAPSWIGLLEHLIEKNPNCKYPVAYYIQNTADNPEIASLLVEEYKTYAWDHYKESIFPDELFEADTSSSMFLKHEISSFFKNLSHSIDLENHEYAKEIELLRKLQPHAIITTNYDMLIESLFPKHSVIVGQQVIKSKKALDIGQILKIHGCVNTPQEIVISSEDYMHFHEKRKYLVAKLLTFFMEHPIIFLGYSISDPNVKKILADISEVVAESDSEIVENIWFVEWSEVPIGYDQKPLTEKSIDLGSGKSIRVNYLIVHSYEELFENLNQKDVSDISALKILEEKVYNIIKSKSITDLEVDLITMSRVEDENSLANMLGIKSHDEEETQSTIEQTILGLGTISDPEQLKATYPYRLSDLGTKLGFSSWHKVNKALVKIEEETGVSIKDSSNRYHVDLGVVSPLHRYSKEAFTLVSKVINGEEYEVFNANDEKIEVTR